MPNPHQNLTRTEHTYPHWITLKHPEIDIIHQSAIIKTIETATVSIIVI